MSSIPIGTPGHKYIPDPQGTKFCKRCEELLTVERFGIDRSRSDGLSFWCRACTRKHKKGRWDAGSKANSWLKHYGVTPEQYHALLEQQSDVCAICKKPETKTIKGTLCYLAVDHDHLTGEIRGLLCSSCNEGLGRFKDSIEFLERAIEYLHSHQ